jgi:hypothetical protein
MELAGGRSGGHDVQFRWHQYGIQQPHCRAIPDNRSRALATAGMSRYCNGGISLEQTEESRLAEAPRKTAEGRREAQAGEGSGTRRGAYPHSSARDRSFHRTRPDCAAAGPKETSASGTTGRAAASGIHGEASQKSQAGSGSQAGTADSAQAGRVSGAPD